MLAQHRAQRLQFGQRVYRAGRVARAVDHHHPSPGRDCRFQLCRRHLEALCDARLHDHRLAFRDQHDVGIGHPVRRGYDHLVARIDHRQCQIEKTLFAAARDQDLLRCVVQSVVALELRDHRRLQRRRAAHRGVLGETLVDRGNRRILDVLRRIEIRFARAQTDDVLAFRLQLCRACGNGKGRGGLDCLYALRE